MKLTINVATRGRPDLLLDAIAGTVPNLVRPDTTLMISVDADDGDTTAALRKLPNDKRILVSIREREDSRGEKYDRALKEAPADIYLPAVDYSPIVTPGFDQLIVDAAAIWPDGIGVVYTDMIDELVPFLQAPTAKFVAKMGYVYNPDYPFWFIDHEMADIAWMIGRIAFAKVRTDTRRRPSKTQRMRELGFWTSYYDLMALERRVKAREIIMSEDFEAPAWLKTQLCNWYPLVEMRSESRNARVRATAAQCEQNRGDAGPPDAGYLRAKAKAEAKLGQLYAALKAA